MSLSMNDILIIQNQKIKYFEVILQFIQAYFVCIFLWKCLIVSNGHIIGESAIIDKC